MHVCVRACLLVVGASVILGEMMHLSRMFERACVCLFSALAVKLPPNKYGCEGCQTAL